MSKNSWTVKDSEICFSLLYYLVFVYLLFVSNIELGVTVIETAEPRKIAPILKSKSIWIKPIRIPVNP